MQKTTITESDWLNRASEEAQRLWHHGGLISEHPDAARFAMEAGEKPETFARELGEKYGLLPADVCSMFSNDAYGAPTAPAGNSGPQFNSAELGAVLAGLRLLQLAVDENSFPSGIHDIATNGGTAQVLSGDEIDDLCERINCGTV
jgi:hypothetical protein